MGINRQEERIDIRRRPASFRL